MSTSKTTGKVSRKTSMSDLTEPQRAAYSHTVGLGESLASAYEDRMAERTARDAQLSDEQRVLLKLDEEKIADDREPHLVLPAGQGN